MQNSNFCNEKNQDSNYYSNKQLVFHLKYTSYIAPYMIMKTGNDYISVKSFHLITLIMKIDSTKMDLPSKSPTSITR